MNQNVIDNETQEKLDAFIKQEEGDSNDYKGLLAKFITLVAVGMSLFHLYAAYSIVPTQQLRVIHVALVLFLVFLSFPIAAAIGKLKKTRNKTNATWMTRNC